MHLLEAPQLYHLYQSLGGFLSARRKSLQQYVELSGVKRIFDIGCGPGHTVQYLPEGIDYIGFDTDRRYIEFATAKFGNRGKFLARHFDSTAANEFGRPDLIMMNGVLHHLDDQTAIEVLTNCSAALSSGGMFYALDPCLVPGQNPIARRLILGDRGKFVRTKEGYEALVRDAFARSEVIIRDDLAFAPYTFSITRGWPPGIER